MSSTLHFQRYRKPQDACGVDDIASVVDVRELCPQIMHHAREVNIKHEVSIALIKQSQANTCKNLIKQVKLCVVVGGDCRHWRTWAIFDRSNEKLLRCV